MSQKNTVLFDRNQIKPTPVEGKSPKTHLKMPKTKLSKSDVIAKWIIIFFTSISILVLVLLIGFVIYQSVPAMHDIGFFRFVFGQRWLPGANTDGESQYGILRIILSTMMILFISLLFVIPLTILSSLFISEYLTPKIKKFTIIIVQLLAGIPSVVFGLFAMDQIGPIFVAMGAATSGNMMTASFTLAFMALPTTITLSINAIESVPDSYRYASLGLGLDKEKTSFSIILKSATPKLITAIVIGMARIIGETMAVVMMAGNAESGLITGEGFASFIFSSVRTLAGTMGLEMLENYGSMHESALYSIGIILFIMVILINLLIMAISNYNNRKTKRIKLEKQKTFEKQHKHDTYHLNPYKLKVLIQTNTDRRAMKLFKSFILKFFMVTSTAIVVGFTSWILLGVTIRGLVDFDLGAFIQIQGQRSGIFATLFTSIILVFNTLVFALPLSMFIAIYLAEYAHKDNKFARIIRFTLNVLASTPSIIFGAFGLSFFIVILGMPISIFVSSLTMTLVILPVLITSIEDALTSVPNSYREAAYGMGMTKAKVVFFVVLPNAMRGIVTGVILSMTRIIGETAPVYLTLGTAVRMPTEGFFSSGAALTTQIYMMAAEGNNPNTISIAYQIALVTLLLVLGLNWLSNYSAKKLSPAYKKLSFKEYWKLRYNRIVSYNYKGYFINVRKFFKNIGLKLINVFNFRLWKIKIINYRTRKRIIKDIIREAKENGRNKTKKTREK